MIASVPLVAGVLLLGWRPQPTVPVDERAYVATTVAVGGGERAAALQLYAAGQFPGACERFSRAAADNPKSPVWRQDVARCFEAWGRDVLRQNRPEEALLLFRQGLKALPDDPALLKAAGIAAIHGGRPTEALEPLERATATEDDVEVRLLLARLYDQRDHTDRALAHLTALLAREPGHAAARRLLEKIERERRVEASFQRETTAHFVVKHRAASGETVRPVVPALERAWERVGADPLLRGPGGLTLVGLEALIGDPDPARARVGYDIALWVTEDLLNRGGIASLRAVLTRLGNGDSVAAAMTKVYGMRLAELESQWRNLLGG